jgi:1-acyl-sn-glycerol-3-phosphate acyltransferase
MREYFHYPIYFISYYLMGGLCRLYFRLGRRNIHYVPKTGGCLLAPNHASYLDPPMIACTLAHRVVHFLARDTLFKGFLGWYLTRIGTMPLDRTKGDLGAIRLAIRELQAGKVLCLFPEGTRSLDGRLQEAKGGIGFLVAKAGVPVVPVYVQGSHRSYPKGARWIKPSKIVVHCGKPILPAELDMKDEKGRSDYDAISRLIMSRIAELQASTSNR